MQDEGPTYAERCTEEARFEDDIVERGSLTGFRIRRCRWAAHRRVSREDEGGEIDFLRELDEAFQAGGPGVEGGRPRHHVRDVFETACHRLEQLDLFPGRPQEDARLVHPISST
jgi:hypothetical protein